MDEERRQHHPWAGARYACRGPCFLSPAEVCLRCNDGPWMAAHRDGSHQGSRAMAGNIAKGQVAD